MTSIHDFCVLVFLSAAVCSEANGFHPAVTSKLAGGGSKDVCTSQKCVRDAQRVAKNIDRSTDPCNDFYLFACGRFLRENDMGYKQYVGAIPNIRDERNKKMLKILKQPIRARDSRSAKIAKKLFQTCMNGQPYTQQSFMRQIRNLFRKFGGWPAVEGTKWNGATFDWKDVVCKLQEAGALYVNPIIDLELEPTNTSQQMISLQLPYSDTKMKHFKNLFWYYRVAIYIGKAFGTNLNKSMYEMEKVMDFENKLFIVIRNQDNSATTNYTTFEELNKEFPRVQLLKYINDLKLVPNLKLSSDTLVNAPSHIRRLLRLLFDTDNRTITNYIYLESFKLILLHKKKTMSWLTDAKSESQLLSSCFRAIEVAGLSKLAMGSVYMRNIFKGYPNEQLNELVKNVKEAFYGMLSSAVWMEDASRKRSLEKAKARNVTLAYPDQLLDDTMLDRLYGDVDINENTFLENIIKIEKREFDLYYNPQVDLQPLDGKAWTMASKAFECNAHNLEEFNSVFIPAPMIHPSLFDSHRPQYMNYGGIGYLIGHEIAHGFDNKGRNYDKDGNSTVWWDKTTTQTFDTKAKCLIKQYNNYTEAMTKKQLDGEKSLGDNIADNAGVRAAYWAYRGWSERQGAPESRLPGLEWLSPRQMFWVAAAQVGCSKSTMERIKAMLGTEYVPDRFRIIGAFSNLKDFAEDFKCDSTKRMNPTNKCKLW